MFLFEFFISILGMSKLQYGLKSYSNLVIFLNGLILPFGGVSMDRVCASSLRSRLVKKTLYIFVLDFLVGDCFCGCQGLSPQADPRPVYLAARACETFS